MILKIIIGIIIYILKVNYFLGLMKIKKIKYRVNSVYIYFNNHYGGKAIVNALQFKELLNKNSLTENELLILEKANKFF